MKHELKILMALFFGGWMVVCSIRSFKRGWVWKHNFIKKVYKDEDPFYFWWQVMLGGTVGVILIGLALNHFSQ